MKPTPQQVEENVLIGSCEPSPPDLEMASRHNGLLKDLVVLGDVPITIIVIQDEGLVHQDRRHQLPIEPLPIKRINPMVTLSMFGYDVPVWSVTLLQGGRKIYSPLGVM